MIPDNILFGVVGNDRDWQKSQGMQGGLLGQVWGIKGTVSGVSLLFISTLA